MCAIGAIQSAVFSPKCAVEQQTCAIGAMQSHRTPKLRAQPRSAANSRRNPRLRAYAAVSRPVPPNPGIYSFVSGIGPDRPSSIPQCARHITGCHIARIAGPGRRPPRAEAHGYGQSRLDRPVPVRPLISNRKFTPAARMIVHNHVDHHPHSAHFPTMHARKPRNYPTLLSPVRLVANQPRCVPFA